MEQNINTNQTQSNIIPEQSSVAAQVPMSSMDNSPKPKKTGMILMITVLIILLAGVAWMYLNKNSSYFTAVGKRDDGRTVVVPNNEKFQKGYDNNPALKARGVSTAMLGAMSLVIMDIGGGYTYTDEYKKNGFVGVCPQVQPKLLAQYNANLSPRDEYDIRTGESVDSIPGFDCAATKTAFAFTASIVQQDNSVKTYCISNSTGDEMPSGYDMQVSTQTGLCE